MAGCFSRQLQEIEIPREFGNAKIRISGLAMSEKFTGSSELQVSAGYLEPVRDLSESLQTLRCLRSCLLCRDQNAPRGSNAAPDPSTKLVKLRDSKSICLLHDHH